MSFSTAPPAARADQFALPAGLLLAVATSVRMLAKYGFAHPQWSNWADQGRYLASASAWAHGLLDPGLHHYPPGYSLMAAPFIRLFPAQPFAVPDLLCLAASMAIFAAFATRLLPRAPGLRAVCVTVFCIATLGSPVLRHLWIVPWNTTASAPFELGALLATLRLCEAPGKSRALVLGLLLGVLAGIRPTDAALLAPCCAAYALAQTWRAGLRFVAALCAIAAAGLMLGALPFAIAHAAVHGMSGGDYLAKSANIGFEWRLLPLRWVTLVVDPRPLLPEGQGLAAGLPWIMPGVAGLLFLTAGSGTRTHAWWLIGAAIAAHWCLYLSYRDLQPYGLWRFSNLHYFKWTYPFLLLAALRLLAALVAGPRRLAAASATAAAILLMLWQPVGAAAGKGAAVRRDDGGIALNTGLPRVGGAIFLPLRGEWRDIYFGIATLSINGRAFRNTWDFKLQPVPGGALLQPLRVLPASGMVLYPAPSTFLPADAEIVMVDEKLRFGIPCALFSRRSFCQFTAYH